MPNHSIRKIVIFGAISIAGILVIQAYWLERAFNREESEFHQTVYISLLNVARKVAAFNGAELPKHGLITRKSSNYYAVNIDDRIDANVLEDYLRQEFAKTPSVKDFEYAVYDCNSQDLVYGNYCKMSDLEKTKDLDETLPAFDDLTYYFVVKFPSRTSYLLSGIAQNIIFSMITLMALAFLIYAIWVILQQKRLSDLQKDFINNMTHEFKTPIASIKIASDVIRSSQSIANDPRLIKYSEIISNQNDRLNNQVEKVLSLARLEQEDFRLKQEIFDISSILSDIISSENMRLQETSKGVIRFDDQVNHSNILADKLHFSNVAYNLIDNALKYCKKVPNLIVRTSLIDKSLILEFVDNGIGISKDEIDKLFLKFYRVSTGNIHDVKGFGLGLYYVQSICEAHGWQIKVNSRINQGSNFSIKIPLHHGK